MTSLRVAWTMLGLASFPGSSCAVEEAGNEAMLGQRNNYLFNGAEVQESRAIPVPLKQHPYRWQVIQLFTPAKKTFFSEDHNHQLSKGTNNGWVHLRTSVNVIQRVMRSAWLITLLSEKKKKLHLYYTCVSLVVNSSLYPGRISVLLLTSSTASWTAVMKGLPSRPSEKEFVASGVMPLTNTARVRVLLTVLSAACATTYAGTLWRRMGSSSDNTTTLALRSTFLSITLLQKVIAVFRYPRYSQLPIAAVLLISHALYLTVNYILSSDTFINLGINGLWRCCLLS